jgi:hypothetical protein
VALAGLATLSACSDAPLSDFPPLCPQTSVLKDASDLTRFQGSGTDLTDMVVDGRITRPTGKCALDDPTHLRTTLNVNLELTRGPASKSRATDVTYFVAVLKGDTVLEKKEYRVPTQFPVNTDHVRLTGDEIDLVLPVNEKLNGAAYRVLIGFQLTPQELAFNRRRGPR